ncbi:MAG: phage holin family protein [Synergistaceae bacterium]|nr:phage holin family protein [Synergistaceae bacterium]MBR0315383.1 phage holin family protein [Synergistaceae bacterium]
MNENNTGFVSILVAILSWFYGGIDGPLKVLLTFVVIDYVLGTIGAIIEHKLSAIEGFRWTNRKVTILILVGISHLIGKEILNNVVPLRDIVICFYIASEGMSIIENADRAKVPIPDVLKKIFVKLKDKNDEEKTTSEP